VVRGELVLVQSYGVRILINVGSNGGLNILVKLVRYNEVMSLAQLPYEQLPQHVLVQEHEQVPRDAL